jgi:sn-glycerol 3-phosphate transport system substrate-binding protein
MAFVLTGSPVARAAPPKPVELSLWHNLTGVAGDQLAAFAARFNGQQSAIRVLPEFKGRDTLAAEAALAARAHGGPDIITAPEVMTAALVGDRRNIRPLHEIISANRERLEARTLLSGLASYYSEGSNRLDALPLTPSTAVLYYNRDALRRASLDPARPPRTWRDVQAMTLALQAAAATPCGYTSDWQSWVQIENLGAWHDEPFATRSNGMDGGDSQLTFNTTFMLRHVSLLSAWARSGLFSYHGRGNEAEASFVSGQCALFTGSSNSLGAISEQARFAFGVAPMPYYDEYDGAPFRSVIGGDALWVMQGRSAAQYKAVARFLTWFAQAEQQAQWHQATGFLPITKAAWDLNRRLGFHAGNSGYEVALAELSARPDSPHGRGVRLPQLARIRAVIDEELEQVWAHTKAPKDALDAAVARGNQILRAARIR